MPKHVSASQDSNGDCCFLSPVSEGSFAIFLSIFSFSVSLHVIVSPLFLWLIARPNEKGERGRWKEVHIRRRSKGEKLCHGRRRRRKGVAQETEALLFSFTYILLVVPYTVRYTFLEKRNGKKVVNAVRYVPYMLYGAHLTEYDTCSMSYSKNNYGNSTGIPVGPVQYCLNALTNWHFV